MERAGILAAVLSPSPLAQGPLSQAMDSCSQSMDGLVTIQDLRNMLSNIFKEVPSISADIQTTDTNTNDQPQEASSE